MDSSLHSDDLVDLGETHHKAGRLQDAEACYNKALELDPTHPGALYFLANIAYDDQRLDLAAQLVERLLSDEPNDAEAWYLLGATAIKQENYTRARECCEKALAIQPTFALAYYALGDLYSREGNLDAAINNFKNAVKLQPSFAEAHFAIGNLYGVNKLFDNAVSSYRQAILLKPDFEITYQGLGESLYRQGKTLEAIEVYRDGVVKNPTSALLFTGLGAMYANQNQDAEAINCFQQAISLDPNGFLAHGRLADVYMKSGRLGDALGELQQAVELNDKDARLLVNISKVYRDLGMLNEAASHARKAVLVDPGFAVAHNSLLSLSQYFPECSREKNFVDHSLFGDRFDKSGKTNYFQYLAKIDPNKRVRIGFVSGDLRRHPVGYFLEGALYELHRRNCVEIIVYSTSAIEDDVTARLRLAAHAWTLVAEFSDDELAARIRSDEIDILVDLSGHTAYNRLLVFAKKPAPVQVTWLGYWETTGLRAIDYILCDEYGVLNEEAKYFTETPWFLPHTRLCFSSPNASVEVAPLPAHTAGFVTFGCFNDLVKMTDDVVRVWAKILDRIPSARLILKSKSLGEPEIRASVIRRFSTHGVSEARLLLEGASPYLEYLATYNRIDIALDPFPFPGGTTSVQGLWMGVPMITLRGDRIISRQGEAIMHNLGLAEWVAESEEDYVNLAVNWAASLDQLALLRSQLRNKLEKSPLCNTQEFAKNLEDAFKQMWVKFCVNSKAASTTEFVEVVAEAALADGLPTRAIDFKSRRSSPIILIAAAPKSGSTFLSNVLSRITQLPYSRLSSAYATNEHDLYLPSLYMMSNGGCVSQMHMKGTFHNAMLMKYFGIKPVILLRDIKDSIISLANDLRDKEKMENFGSGQNGFSFLWQDQAIASLSESGLIDCIIDLAVPWYVNFYVSWYRLCARNEVDAMWVTYEELMRSKRETVSRILEFTGFDSNISIDDDVLGLRFSKFNSGQSGRGAQGLSEEQKSKIKRLLSYYPDVDFSKFGI